MKEILEVGELGEKHGVDPFAVSRAVDLREVLRLHMRGEERLHALEAGQVAVVREHQRHVPEVERVHVLQSDLDARRVGYAAHVPEHAGRADLVRQVLQVAIEHRQRERVVGERSLRVVACRIPRAQAEPGEVQHAQHVRHVRLADERRVGTEQQIVEQHGLSEVEQRAAHLRYGREVLDRSQESSCARAVIMTA